LLPISISECVKIIAELTPITSDPVKAAQQGLRNVELTPDYTTSHPRRQ
jgi:hypothetical protein